MDSFAKISHNGDSAAKSSLCPTRMSYLSVSTCAFVVCLSPTADPGADRSESPQLDSSRSSLAMGASTTEPLGDRAFGEVLRLFLGGRPSDTPDSLGARLIFAPSRCTFRPLSPLADTHLVFSACFLAVNSQLESLSFLKGWTLCFQNGVEY